jgi:thiol-disulfide isomerase/thioredoxin
MAPKVLTEGSFLEAISKGIVLVDFWAPWCSPCRAFTPIFEKAANDNDDVTFCKVDMPGYALQKLIDKIRTLDMDQVRREALAHKAAS